MFNLILKKLPKKTCYLFEELQIDGSSKVGSFEGVLQEVSSELVLEFGGGISHNLYADLRDFKNIDIGRNALNGLNVISIEDQRYEIIKTKKVEYKEGGHLEILLNKNAS